ncbi:MAG: glycosyltransferase family protein [Lachnospiraceae bacterium]|nr:glycosyltransferase family protein [Lachnospiraceae bacterium]
MDKTKISFIICSNNDIYLEECSRYIRNLKLPEGFTMDIIPVRGAKSMTAGYNQGMQLSDAEYKVYLHQDVFLLNENFIADILSIFQKDEHIGMIGMVGTKKIPTNACMWTTPMRTGAIYSCTLNTVEDRFDLPIPSRRGFVPVDAVDGLLIVTCRDIPWREDLNLGWDFYDVSQSLEFAKAGYRVVVPYQETPWTLHDNGFLHLGGYHTSRERFLQAYFPERTTEIADCEAAVQRFLKKQVALEAAVSAVKQSIYPLLADSEYEKAVSMILPRLEEFQEDEEFCILYILADIHRQEMAKNMPSIFSAATHIFSTAQESVTSSKLSAYDTTQKEDTTSGAPYYFLYHHMKFLIWREKYLSIAIPDYPEISEIAWNRIREFC